MRVTYYQGGRAYPVPEAVLPATDMKPVLAALLAGTSDVQRMFVHDELIPGYRRRGTALEVVLPAKEEFHTGGRGRIEADRFFVVLPEALDGKGVLVFHGTGGYGLPPLSHTDAREVLAPVRPGLDAASRAGPGGG